MKIAMKRVLTVAVIMAVVAMLAMPVHASVTSEYPVYKVTTRANLRSSASINGGWIYTLPTGVLVVLLDEKADNSYYHVQYGEYEGYIYCACISKCEDKEYADYVNQFPELADLLSSMNKPSTTESVTVTQEELQESIHSGSEALTAANTGISGSYRRGSMSVTGLTMNPNDKNSADEMIRRASVVYGTLTTRAKIRMAPSVESQQISVIPEGATVTIIDGGENGYTHIMYDGTEGYVYTRCIDYDESMVESGGSGITSTVVVEDMMTGSLDEALRSLETTSVTSQRQALASMASVSMVESGLMNTVTTSEISTPVQEVAQMAPESASDTVSELAENVISRAVNLRSLPDQASNKITTIPRGANVTVLGSTQGGYTMVQYNGITGYVLENCVVDSLGSSSSVTYSYSSASSGTSYSLNSSDVVQSSTGGILFTCSAYCSCRICCGAYSPEVTGRESHTATGTVPMQGRTIAVDPTVIPYGTSVTIEGMGTFVAEDCGGAIKGNRIDIYFSNHQDALNFGVRRLYVYL